MRITAVLVLAVVVLLSGCAFAPYQPLDAANRQKIKTIGLVSVPNPAQYRGTAFSNPALLFGALGGAVAGASAESRSAALDSLLRGAGFDYGKRMEKALASELERAGYKVVPIALPRSSDNKFAEDFSTVEAYHVDALLDTSIFGVGYYDVNFTDSAFRPAVNIQAHLISWPGRQPLFSETILFGYKNPLIPGAHIPAPSSYFSSSFDDVLHDRDRAIEGLEYGITSVASHIGQRLGGAEHAVDSGVYAQRSPSGGDSASVSPVRESTPIARADTSSRAQTAQPSVEPVRESTPIARGDTNPLAQTAQPKAAQAKFGKFSFEVEKMAKGNGCHGSHGAYLTTDAGPVEGYRVECDGGVVYVARCEYSVCIQQQ
jgi:hypothetical protein